MRKFMILGLLLTLGSALTIQLLTPIRERVFAAGAKQPPQARARLSSQATVQAAGRGTPWINLRDGRDLLTTSTGTELEQILASHAAQPLALASGDFDEDGVPDLVSGYVSPGRGILTLHRGNVDTLHPNTPEAQERRAAGTFTEAPFLAPARVFEIPVAPDFLGTGDFDADGHLDVVAAVAGGEALYWLRGDGQGFWPAVAIPLPGSVTALLTGEINRADGLADLVVGIAGAGGPQVLIFESPNGALRGEPEAFALSAAPTALALGQLDDGYAMDLAVAAGTELLVVHGRDRRLSLDKTRQAEVPAAVIEEIPLPFAVTALAVGDFTGNQPSTLALLSSDGMVRVLERKTEDGRWGNLIGEMAVGDHTEASAVAASSPPRVLASLLVRARVSSRAVDDLIVVDRSHRQLHVLMGETLTRREGETAIDDSAPPRAPVTLDVAGEPVAVLPMRLNVDALSDLVILKSGSEASLAIAETAVVRTFVVNLTTNQSDPLLSDNKCDIDLTAPGDQCTFPAATQQANFSPGEDAITFTVTSVSGGGFVSDPAIIDGGASRVDLGGNSIFISAGNSTVRGLVVNEIRISSKGGNIIEGNFIGTDVAGKAPRDTSGGSGVEIDNAPSNMIGGATAAARNLISGNHNGVQIRGSSATGNQVQGNFIGVDVTGTVALSNRGVGVAILAPNNTIGGTTDGARNIISSNLGDGISINSESSSTQGSGNQVQGNFIGTNFNGTQALSNGSSSSNAGVTIFAPNNTIGGPSIGARNIISGHTGIGVLINGPAATGNQVQANFIGTDASGVVALSNRIGVRIDSSANNNTIGGTAIGARNLISGNTEFGVEIASNNTAGNQVQGNFIGTKSTGTEALGNRDGVRLSGAVNSLIGGTTSGAGNVISGNRENGVNIASGSGNRVQGNFIGTQPGGTNAVGNGINGVLISASNNTIGGTEGGASNTIAFNVRAGVSVSSGTGNGIRRNSIFSNLYMAIDLGGNGTNLNDPKDPDSGANNSQNYPDLFPSADGTTRQWKLNSTPNTTFTIEFFSNTECGSSGQGEGKTFTSSTSVTTDANGDAIIAGPSGGLVTATATDPNNNTSEFSHCGEPPALVVNTAGDEFDAHPGGGVCDVDLNTPGNQCTLRAAITEANNFPGKQTITFNIPGGGVPTIQPIFQNIPAISDPVVLDATTQPGGKVELVGTLGNLSVGGGNSTVKGFVIGSGGIFLFGSIGSNVIQGNFIGTDVTGTARVNSNPGADGVNISSPNNLIGGTKPEERNVISGNTGYGVRFTGFGANGNRVEGNFIGVDVTGTVALGNTFGGVLIEAASNNTIGGTAPGARNIISGNTGQAAVEIVGLGTGPAKGNKVQGNFIGLDVNGTKALGNATHGVQINDKSNDSANNTTNNLIGGTTPEARNVISGNGTSFGTGVGVLIFNGVGGNLVQGNFIGTDVTGTVAIGNRSGGILIGSSVNSQVGGTAPGAGNLISGNGGTGISINGTGTLVQGNFIGTDVTGTKALGNSEGITAFPNATIGGTAAGARNVISGNGGNGVRIAGNSSTGATGNLVQGNFIGTDLTGTKPLGNGSGGNGNGVVLTEAAGNTIGGATAGAGNIIAFNQGTGVLIIGPDTSTNKNKNRVSQNSIFSNSRLGIDLSKQSSGFDGITPNDAADPDTGPNDLQNFPELTIDADGTTIKGTLNSKPGTAFTIEFFSNTECDPAGNGEGETFLGAMTVTTDGSGQASFTAPFPAPANKSITATATDPDGNTSEFSRCAITSGGPPPAKAPITISGQKFEDQNGNGRKDALEPGLPGWTIRLDLDSDGTIDGVATTDANGRYSFPGLGAGRNINISRLLRTQSEATIAVDPKNPSRLFAASNGSDKLFAAYSTDGGVTWTYTDPSDGFIADGNDNLPRACCDPSAAFDEFGNLFLTYMNNARDQVVILISTNGGQNFSSLAAFAGTDQPTVATGPGDEPGKGSAWVVYQNQGGAAIEARGARVNGVGAVEPFGNAQVVRDNANVNFADLAIGPNGQVLVVYQIPATGPAIAEIFNNLDPDGLGPQSFNKDTPTRITSTNIGGATCPPAQRLRCVDSAPGLAWDRKNNRIYLVYTESAGTGSPVMEILVRISLNEGNGWTQAKRVNDVQGNSRFLPRIAVDQITGCVGVAWHDSRNDTGNRGPGDTNGKPNDDTQLFAAISLDGGANFLPNVQVSAGTSNADSACSAIDYGDYIGLAFHNGILYPAWADNSNSTGDNPQISATCPAPDYRTGLAVREMDIYTAAVRAIMPGTHTLSEVLQPGWTQTFPAPPGTHTVVTQPGNNITDRDFGNFKNMRACGRKFLDKDGNGKRDDPTAEPGLPGWTIYIDVNRNGRLDPGEPSAVTDAQGNYCIENIGPLNPNGPRTFIIREVLQPGWCQTLPAPPNDFYENPIQSGLEVLGADFGNFKKVKLSGMKFDDKNGNGKKDTGETGLQGWTIQLDLDNNGSIDKTAVTDASGNYSFDEICHGTHKLSEVLQPGWVQTFPTPIPPGSYTVKPQSGMDIPNLDFGNFKKVKLTGMKFNDKNGDGKKDTGETGLQGWTIQLDLDNDGTIDKTIVTDASGNCSFDDIGPGTHKLSEVLQPGWVQTFPTPIPPGTHLVTPQSGMDPPSLDFGNFKKVKLSGMKFDDKNGNGKKDPGEPGLKDWTIQLDLDNNGSIDRTATTDADGKYSFDDVGPGKHKLSEVLQPGWWQTFPTPVPPGTYIVMPQSGMDIPDLDFGNFKKVRISGMKFHDLNNNGVKDQGEPGLSGWTIELDLNNDGSVDRTTTTDDNGNYSFSEVGPGTHKLSEVAQSGWTQTAPTPVPPGAYTIITQSGVDVPNRDFGNRAFGGGSICRIIGQKYNDRNGNGRKDENERGLAGWTIFLNPVDTDGDGIFDSGDQTAVTDGEGNYEFRNLTAGVYTVGERLKPGWIQTAPQPVPPGTHRVTMQCNTSDDTAADRDFGNFQAVEAPIVCKPASLQPGNSAAAKEHDSASAALAPSATTQAAVSAAYGQLPLTFEANQGQADSRVKFLSRGSGYNLFLTPAEMVLALKNPRPSMAASGKQSSDSGVLRLRFVGANLRPQMIGRDELPSKNHYFIGSDPRKHHTNIANYAKVEYREVYPGVNLIYYGNQRQLEYDLILEPGANPRAIKLAFEGAVRLDIDARGDLILRLPGGEVRQHKPVIYQEIAGVKHFIPGRYVRAGRYEVGFQVAQYDRSQPLVIDPVLSYSTYLGGLSTDEGYSIAVDAAGNAYVTGRTFLGTFPTVNPAQTWPGDNDFNVFVAKLNAAGNALLYSTYLGGLRTDEGFGIAVDASGNAYVTGRTFSQDFPLVNALMAWPGDNDFNAFVAKLNPAGNALLYSTYLGGQRTDEGYGIAVDAAGSAYVTGRTFSQNFPTANAFQTWPGDNDFNAFVTKLNAAGNGLLYSTYLGGLRTDEGYSIAVDAAGNAYVTGRTFLGLFPTVNPVQTWPGDNDFNAFVTKLDLAGRPIYSTYLGGLRTDCGCGIAVDPAGNAHVTGFTFSQDFPTVNPFQTWPGDNDFNAFVTKLNAGGAFIYSTYLGGLRTDEGLGIAADAAGNTYVTGRTFLGTFPTVNPFQTWPGDNDFNAFVTKLNLAGRPVYSSYLGGLRTDEGFGIAADGFGHAYVTGRTFLGLFPTVNPVQPWPGDNDFNAFVAKIISGIEVKPASLDFGSALIGQPKDLTLTIREVGNGALTVNALTSSNPQFTLTSPTAPFNIQAGNEQTVHLRFTPAAAGAQSATLTVNSDDPSRPSVNVTLMGNGLTIAPALELTLSSLDFGSVSTGQHKDLTLTASNTGNAALIVNSITSDNSRFSVTAPALPFTLAAGAQQTIKVRFTPSAAGGQTGKLTISSNAANRPEADVSLAGSGVGTVDLSVAPATLDFGSVAVGQSASRTLTITNPGTATLSLPAITSSQPHFSVALPAVPTNIAPGASANFTARFAPTSAGAHTATLLVASNAPDKPVVAVQARGETPGGQPTETLATDDGTVETGALSDGLIIVNRLRPPSYPVTLRSLRIFFAQFQNLPSPVGEQIRLIAFVDPTGSGQPPANPSLLLDQLVTIPSIPANGGFIEFPVQASLAPAKQARRAQAANPGEPPALTIESVDLYVGFQAPRPARGVVFAADSSGPQQQRAFFSTNDGASYVQLAGVMDSQGTVTQVNIMTQAVVSSVGVCNYSITPNRQAFDAAGGSGSVTVTAPAGCAWSANSPESWVTLGSSANQSGNGTINFMVAAGTGARRALVAIAGQTLTVAQAQQVVSVSGASFSESGVAREAITSVFGVNLATGIEAATRLPLPTSLLGTTVKVTDSLGSELFAPLFFVSPGQVNFQMPPGLAPGTVTITVTNGNGVASIGTAQNEAVAPGLFTFTADGRGVPAAIIRRFRNGQEIFPSVLAAQLDAQNRWVPLPIDLGPDTDLVILELFGTGLRFRTALSAVSVKIGGVEGQMFYAGEAPGFVGLDQIDVAIPRSLIGRGEVDVVLMVDGKTANTVKVSIK
jgi:uncharacterized protein (TIGR03437 family)